MVDLEFLRVYLHLNVYFSVKFQQIMGVTKETYIFDKLPNGS